MASAAESDEFAQMKPATVAVFQYDQVAFALKDPEILLPGMALTIGSNAELWKNAMVRRTDQELPLVSVCFVKDGFTRHILTFPDGTGNMKLIVNNKELTPEAMVDGCILTGGELIKVYCTHWLRNGEVVDERVGPLTLQYRAAENCGEEPHPQHPKPERSLEELRPEILRLIFAHLPVDEVLYNIPAVSLKFLDAVRDKMAFKNCEITDGWLTSQEATFFHGWRANPVTHLVLRGVQLADVSEVKSFCHFLGTGMEPASGSMLSLEVTLLVGGPGTSAGVQTALDGEVFQNFGNQLKAYQALKSLKIKGYPALHGPSGLIVGPLPNLERLWASFSGKSASSQSISTKIHLVRNLKVVTLKFVVENELVPFSELKYRLAIAPRASRPDRVYEVELARRVDGVRQQHHPNLPPADDLLVEVPGFPPGDFEFAFWIFAPNLEFCPEFFDPERKRVLILDIKGDCWVTLRFFMLRMTWLTALSLTIESPMTDSQMRLMVESFPTSLRFLHLATATPFNDRQCLTVASHCPELEILSCSNAGGLTKKCLDPLAVSCEKLKGLLFYKEDNGVLVPRKDILPKRFMEKLKEAEEELKAIFD